MQPEPCPHCGTTVRHSDRVGCCAACGVLFSGMEAFDRHRDWSTGEPRCHSPQSARRAGPDGEDLGPLYRPSKTSGTGDFGVIWSLTRTPAQQASTRVHVEAMRSLKEAS